MKRDLLFILGMSLFLVTSLGYAQEKLTEEQAERIIQQYKNREDAASTKIKEEEGKIVELKKAIVELDGRITQLQSEISKAKEAAVVPSHDIYVVKAGDWLSKLAEYPEVYGHGNYALWPRIYNANKDLIKNPNLISPGWQLKVPRDK